MKRPLRHTILAALLAGLPLFPVTALADNPPPASGQAATQSTAPVVLPANIPVKREAINAAGGSDASSLAWLGVLVLLVLVGYPAVKAWRQNGFPGIGAARIARPATQLPRLLGSTRLTARHSVHVVEWEGRRLLLACTDQQISVLASNDLPAPASEGSGEGTT